jgi:hypothetical protein
MIDFGLAMTVAIDAYRLGDNLKRRFFPNEKKTVLDIFSPPPVEDYLLWQPPSSAFEDFTFNNLTELMLFTYPDAVPYDVSRELASLGEGGNYLLEYYFPSIAAFYTARNERDFVEILSNDTGVRPELCRPAWSVFKNKPYAAFPCDTKEQYMPRRDVDISSYIMAYSKIINDLPSLTDKRVVFFGGKLHADFLVKNVKGLFPKFDEGLIKRVHVKHPLFG